MTICAWTTRRRGTPSAWRSVWSSSPSPGAAYLTAHTARLVEGYFALRSSGRSRSRACASRSASTRSRGSDRCARGSRLSRARGFSKFVGRADRDGHSGGGARAQPRGAAGRSVGRGRGGGDGQEPALFRVRRALPRAAASRSTKRTASPTAGTCRCCRCWSSSARTSGSRSTTGAWRLARRSPGGCCCSTRACARICRSSSTCSACPIPTGRCRAADPRRGSVAPMPPSAPSCAPTASARSRRSCSSRICTGSTPRAMRYLAQIIEATATTAGASSW